MEILELKILSADLESTKRFYTEVLQLVPHESNNTSVSFFAGNSILVFEKTDVEKPVYHVAFATPDNLMEKALDWIRKKVSILPVDQGSDFADFRGWNARAFYFTDSQGNILEFISRLGSKDDSDAQTNHPFIRFISEIGIVVENVPAASKLITEKLKLEAYAKQKVLENFGAIGSDDGLFILVSKGRKWYPTEIESGVFKTEVLLRRNGKTSRVIFPELTVAKP